MISVNDIVLHSIAFVMVRNEWQSQELYLSADMPKLYDDEGEATLALIKGLANVLYEIDDNGNPIKKSLFVKIWVKWRAWLGTKPLNQCYMFFPQ
jgi:hypothetical protein